MRNEWFGQTQYVVLKGVFKSHNAVWWEKAYIKILFESGKNNVHIRFATFT